MSELVITRHFAAPRHLVYRAFTDPDQLAAWFGPVGFSVPRDSVSIDARVGGHQRFTMVSDSDPSLTSPVNATFTEVVEDELLAGEEALPDGTTFSLRVELADADGGTLLTLTQGPLPDDMVEPATAGWESSFTKLDKQLT